MLIRKKRGHGAGKINGPGGKLHPGETPVVCAVRETLDLSEEDVEQRRALVYRNVEKSSLPQIGWLFLVGVIGAVLGGVPVSSPESSPPSSVPPSSVGG